MGFVYALVESSGLHISQLARATVSSRFCSRDDFSDTVSSCPTLAEEFCIKAPKINYMTVK